MLFLNKKTLSAAAHITLAGTALAASGCAKSTAVRLVPPSKVSGAVQKSSINPSFIPSDPQHVAALSSLAPAQKAQAMGLLGSYSCGVSEYDANGDEVISLCAVSLQLDPSGDRIQANYTNDDGTDFQALMSVTALQAPGADSIVLASPPMDVPTMSPSRVVLFMQLGVSASNAFNPSVFQDNNIRILSSPPALEDVAYFYTGYFNRL